MSLFVAANSWEHRRALNKAIRRVRWITARCFADVCYALRRWPALCDQRTSRCKTCDFNSVLDARMKCYLLLYMFDPDHASKFRICQSHLHNFLAQCKWEYLKSKLPPKCESHTLHLHYFALFTIFCAEVFGETSVNWFTHFSPKSAKIITKPTNSVATGLWSKKKA